jgi:hypothetical protein
MQQNLEREQAGPVVSPPSDLSGRDVVELSPQSASVETVYKVIVGIPLMGGTPAASYHDRMMMFKYLGHREEDDYHTQVNPRYCFNLNVTGDILVQYARERFAESVLESGADYLFMIDDDMLAPPDLFFRLAANDKDICAALAFTRNPDHKPVIYDVIEGFDPVTKKDYYVNKFSMNYPRNSLVQCDAVGFGAVLIKRKVIEAMKTPRFMGMMGCGEDITFCYKAKKLGFEVWMDTRIKLGHLGAPTVITEDYANEWMHLTPEQRDKIYGQYTRYPTMEIK